MRDTFIIGAARTAIGSFCGTLKDQPAHRLGSIAIKAALERATVEPGQVDEVILGCILQAGQGQGPGRQAALAAGIPQSTPAWAINQLCGSGLKAVCLASTMIASGEAEIVVAGGMESMSQAPFLVDWARNGQRYGNAQMQDEILRDALTDAFSGDHMGLTAEAIAARYELTRAQQDAFAAESQRRAGQALKDKVFEAEIAPVVIQGRKGETTTFAVDEYPKPDTTAEKLAKLKPAFKVDGTVTAGNASGINDGAAAVVVASADFVKKHGLVPLARIAGHATTALDPKYMGLGPVESSRKALARAGWKLADLERAELNEAFAAQSLAVVRDLAIDPAIVNPNGGAIALGHPVGASGARILVTLIHGLERSRQRKGLAALCVGGGMGTAMVVERP